MKRLAVVMGAENGLKGVRNDVETMSELLGQRGFEVRRCVGDRSTRAALLEELERLISRTEPGDKVVVTYSGHGGSLGPDVTPGPLTPDLQFLVPADFDESTPDDPRVVTSLELSVAVARLSERTDNCTVVLDCCHSGHMARDPRLRTKALAHPAYLDIAGHNQRMRRDGLRTDLLDAVGNRRAVRIVASQPFQLAYEHTGSDGRTNGLLTDSLRIALDEADGEPVPWAALMDRIRSRVGAVAPNQRPQAEGPAGRLVFETTEADVATTLPLRSLSPTRVALPGARLTGAATGDTFAVLPAGVTEISDDAIVAVATVDRVGSTGVEAALTFRVGHTAVPPGARAQLLSTTARRWPLVVAGTGTAADELRAAIRATAMLRVAAPEEEQSAAEIEVGERLTLCDAAGPLAEPADADAAGVRRMVANATLLARAAAVRAVTPQPGLALTDPVTVEWGRVVAAEPRPLPLSGAVVHRGDHVYVRLRNDGDRNVFVHLLGLGVDGEIVPVLAHAPSGLRLVPGQEYLVGQRDTLELEGLRLSWPDGVPAGAPRPESLLVLVTSALVDLSVLAQAGVRDPWVAKAATRTVEQLRSTGNSLQRLLAQAVIGGRRTVAAEHEGAGSLQYAMHPIDFLLSPMPRPAEERTLFQVDERPPPSVRLLTRPGTPAELAVRFTPLRFDHARSGAVRLDSLVITSANGLPVFQARTLRFDEVHAATAVQVDDAVLYQGPAGSCLDLACWISADRPGVPDLAELLEKALTGQDFHASAALLTASAPAQPDAALAVAECDATALAINAAHVCLSTVDESVIGLCRATWHSGERFGVGRHPKDGLLRAGGISFAYTIEAMG